MGKTVEGVLSKQVRGSYKTHGQSRGRSSKYGSMGVPIECMGRTVEGVLSKQVRGSYRTHGQSGGRSSE